MVWLKGPRASPLVDGIGLADVWVAMTGRNGAGDDSPQQSSNIMRHDVSRERLRAVVEGGGDSEKTARAKSGEREDERTNKAPTQSNARTHQKNETPLSVHKGARSVPLLVTQRVFQRGKSVRGAGGRSRYREEGVVERQ